jgi:hypothetical protein
LKCADCELNAWGSEITPAGAESKKCKDYRRLAFCITQKDNYKIYRLDIRPASLKALEQYGVLATAAGVPLDAIFTQISFDPVKLNKLKFDALRLMPLEQHEDYKKLTSNPRVTEILTQKTSTKVANKVENTSTKVAAEVENTSVTAPQKNEDYKQVVDKTAIDPLEPVTVIESAQDIEAELDAMAEVPK